ncbi:MAG: DNA-binding CsgD family transcriptional regulator [Myxococcota bacterium]|jgi:DNA-binding CsgD family transcriptional regulator
MLRLAALAKAQDASTIRRAVLSEFARLTDSDYAVFHDTVHEGDNERALFGQVLVEGPESIRQKWKTLEGVSYAELGLGVEHISAMDSVTAVTRNDLPAQWVNRAWTPVDVHCSLRINCLDGAFFGGQIAGVRVSSRPVYRRSDIRAAQSFLPLALGGLRMACRLSRTTGPPAWQLFKPDGTPWMGTAAEFPSGLSSYGLSEWVQHITDANLSCDSQFFGRYRLEALVLSGEYRRGILVSVRPMHPLHVPKVLMLTPTQRQVASYAASGATVYEIAEHLQRSPDTVKWHLKTLYKELGVASRIELRGMVQNFRTAS